MDDAEALRTEAPSIVGVSPIHRMIAATIRYQDKQTDTPILFGVTPYYEFVQTQYVASGRFINDIDMQDRSNVVIIGVDVKQALFPYEDPLDKEVRINGNPYRVIGVMEPLGTSLASHAITRSSFRLRRSTSTIRSPFPEVVFFVIVRPRSRATSNPRLTRSLISCGAASRAIGAPNNFGISSQDSLLDVYNQLTGATALVLTSISFVALMIGGIGVMNIMLVSVTERTKEIGVRKAVGATRFDILSQFLIEAVVLTAIGGLTGLAVGEVASLLMNKYSPLPAYVPLWAIGVGVGVSAAVGIIFGLWPAWKAAD